MTKSKADQMLDELLMEDPEKHIPHYERENFVLEPLLEEIELIEDEGVRNFVRSVLVKTSLFWEIPSSFSEDSNPPDEHEVGGNVLHTKRVVRVVELLLDSYTVEASDRDLVIAAALLHDITKGVLEDGLPTYDPYHAYTVDRFVREAKRVDEMTALENHSTTLYITEQQVMRILRMIRCHRGPWSPIPETYPFEELELILHAADHIACKLHTLIDGDDYLLERWKF